jgi:hypothetical protein
MTAQSACSAAATIAPVLAGRRAMRQDAVEMVRDQRGG